MTSRQHWPKPDLLQQRRLELGLPLQQAPVPSMLSLVLKGGIGALVLVMLAVLTLLGLQHRQQVVQSEIAALNPVERRVGDAKDRLRAMTSRRSTLEQQTRSIAEQLVAVRSGSALLEQLRQVTPQGVRLVSVDANPSKLLIKGEAQGTDAFERINALDLNIEALPDMLLDGTTVVKAVADQQGRIDFSLEAKLDPAMKPTPAHLRGLGAEGLARRLERHTRCCRDQFVVDTPKAMAHARTAVGGPSPDSRSGAAVVLVGVARCSSIACWRYGTPCLTFNAIFPRYNVSSAAEAELQSAEEKQALLCTGPKVTRCRPFCLFEPAGCCFGVQMHTNRLTHHPQRGKPGETTTDQSPRRKLKPQRSLTSAWLSHVICCP